MHATETDEALVATGTPHIIKLPDGVKWPDMNSTVLYVRYFYKDLWERVLHEGLSNKKWLDAVIMGTPGSE